MEEFPATSSADAALPSAHIARAMFIAKLIVCSVLLAFATRHAHALDNNYVGAFACDHGPFGLRLPPSYPELRALAEKVDEQAHPVEADGPVRTQRLRLLFSGLDLQTITILDGASHYLLASAIVDDARWNSLSFFRIGEPAADLRARLRAAGVSLDGAHSFGSEGGSVTFDEQNGRVSKVTYQCYTG